MQDAKSVDTSPEAIAGEGALKQSAMEVFRKAPALCQPEHGCLHYHRLWPVARLAKSTGPTLAGVEFFEQQLGRLNYSSQIRILIFGAADTGLLATLCQCLGPEYKAVQFILVDRCATVIWQNECFAKCLGLDIEFIQADLQSLEIQPVDVIVAHSILNFFGEAARLEILAMWRTLLRKEGMVLLSNSVYAEEGQRFRKIHPRFNSERVLKFAQQNAYSLDDLEQMEETFENCKNEGMQVYTPAVEKAFLQQITCARLHIQVCNRHPVTPEQQGPISSLTSVPKLRLECCLTRAC